jgi:4-diphosphocytidyl-2-C-methyl-D-erythritol kinase
MNVLEVPAPAKLNLFLHVTGRRADGYHLLQTLFVFLDRCDTIGLEATEDGLIRRVADNYLEPVDEEKDLVVRAARLLQQHTGCKQGANIRVHKILPMGGGLGGGSSDAASTLLGLNRLWELGLSPDHLARIGLALGADVPVFVRGQAAWAEGVGEELHPVELADFHALVVVPPVGVATPRIFTHPELTRNSIPIKMASFPAGNLAVQQKRFIASQRNDLQPVACALESEVALHLSALCRVSGKSWFAEAGVAAGGEARMTGSGACVFALFDTADQAAEAREGLPSGMQSFIARGRNRHPFHEKVEA